MIPIARIGDTHVCPIPGHGSSPIVSASSDTLVNTLGAARVGDVCGCGAAITTGFPSIIVDGRPLAYLGSPSNHGGTIISGSGDSFGGFVTGGAGAAFAGAIIDFAKLGAVRPDGSVDEVRMAALLDDPQLEQKALLSNALIQPSAGQGPAPATNRKPEYIAVAGVQHDESYGNKMMFIAQAVRQLALFRQEAPDAERTLIVCAPRYTQAMLDAARESAELYGAGFITVETADSLIEYLNTGKDRAIASIANLSIYAHGVPFKIALGYETEHDWPLAITWMNLDEIAPEAFSNDAVFESYACRTGMGNRSEFPIEDVIQGMPETNQSLAQLIANHLQIKVRAFIRRSDYKNTWGRFEERQLGRACDITGNRAPDGEWCRRWKTLAQERADTIVEKGFNYQVIGAINPVESGDTPLLSPGGFFDFLPQD